MKLKIEQSINVIDVSRMTDKDQTFIRGYDTFTWTLFDASEERVLASGKANTEQGALNQAQIWIEWLNDGKPKVTKVQI